MDAVELDRNGLEVLDRDECLRLLSSTALGRIGLTSGALPTVLPVNFCLDRDRILILTSRGSKLDAAARNAVVAFEVDEFDLVYHGGWSVVVTGVAHEVTDPDELESISRLPLARWAPWDGGRVMAIDTDVISGRRITAGIPRTPPTTAQD